MDRQEGSYSKKWAILHAYDGRQLNGYAYIIYKEPGSEELNPSSRYLELLVKGMYFWGQIIYSFDDRSPSRHKQSFYFILAGALMEHFFDGIVPLRYWYVNPNEKSNNYKSSLLG